MPVSLDSEALILDGVRMNLLDLIMLTASPARVLFRASVVDGKLQLTVIREEHCIWLDESARPADEIYV
jgi:hypothetical protein